LRCESWYVCEELEEQLKTSKLQTPCPDWKANLLCLTVWLSVWFARSVAANERRIHWTGYLQSQCLFSRYSQWLCAFVSDYAGFFPCVYWCLLHEFVRSWQTIFKYYRLCIHSFLQP
jgi:hypothetical protein